MNHQRRIFVRLDRCVGCHSCELACSVAHARSRFLALAIQEDPKPQKRIFLESSNDTKAPIHCRHCEEAPCAAVCPTGALFSDLGTGVVQYREQRCIGCFICTMACPFGVIRADHQHRFIVKCDCCPELETPACVSACPTRALLFQTEADYERARRTEVSRLFWAPLHSP
jgi:carbon-monoxide dehydrogenase iron sulfur subunit